MNDIFRWIGDHGLPVAAIIFVTFGLYIGGVMFMDRIVKRALHATKRDWHEQDIKKRQRTLVALFKNIWRAVIVTTGTLIILHELFPDVSLAPIFASAGIIGIALGFGAQSLVQDFTSGLFIISENQYRVGDIIDIEGASGTVERIGVRTTVLRDADGNVHYIPNGMVKQKNPNGSQRSSRLHLLSLLAILRRLALACLSQAKPSPRISGLLRQKCDVGCC
jgi:small conductance mechanosensitive channel